MVALWQRLTRRNKTPQQLLSSGDHEGALEAFLKLSPSKRNDPSTMNQIADLYKRLNKTKSALKYYVMVGEYYGERGFFNKAVAAFKKGLNLDPKNEGVLTKLAELNEKVPKYMIDSSIMEKIRNLDTQKETPKPPASIITPGGQIIEEPDPIPVAELDITLGPEDLEALPGELTQAPAEAIEPAAMEEDEAATIEPTSVAKTEAPEQDPEADMPEAAPAIDPSEPTGSHEPMQLDLTDEDVTENSDSQLELHPKEFWDQEIQFDTDATREPQPERSESISPEPLPPSPASEDLTDQQSTSLADLLGESEDEAAEELIVDRPHVVFKKRERETQPASSADASAPSFSSFDDAIDSIFTVESQPLTSQHREENRRHWPIFRTMPPNVFMDFVVALEQRLVEANAFVVRQGDPGAEMFLITEGEVEVLVSSGARSTKVATLTSGDFFGEGSLLTRKSRNASIRTTKATELLVLNQDQFDVLVKSHPSVLETLKSVFLARSRQNPSSE